MIALSMRAERLDNLPVFELPEGYGWRYYQPGDELAWAEIWRSAGQFETEEAALKAFQHDFSEIEKYDDRMIFLTDHGVPFATACAWFEDEQMGRLHWVAIDTAHQGSGLARPLVCLAMRRMRELGHTSAWLATYTINWVAIGIYRQFGFAPMLRREEEIEGWRIVSERSGIDYINQM